MSGGYSGKFSRTQCKIQFFRDNSGEQKVLKTPYCRVSKSLKPRILAAMVLPPGYTGFITNLPFRATQRLEHMYNVKNVFSFLVYKLIWTAV